MKITGKCSWFGGPEDVKQGGITASEDLAFIYSRGDQPELFLPESEVPANITGLAGQLDPSEFYIAMRWPYTSDTKAIWREALLSRKVLVRNPENKKEAWAFPADWGPHEDTGRIADLSPALLDFLGLETDDEVEVIIPTKQVILPSDEEESEFPYPSIVISSGHGKFVPGAIGILDEHKEAVRVVDRVAEILSTLGVDVTTFEDQSSHDQSTNLHTIVNFHNNLAPDHQLDVSVHFNANVETDSPMGTECLYVTQDDLAADIALAIATNGLKNRGPKYRGDLFFLNNTDQPAILIEVCFVDSSTDAEIYQAKFDEICASIANVLSGGGNVPIA